MKMWQVFLKNSLAVPQRVIHRVLIQPSNSTPKYTPKRTENIGSQVFTALFITARMWKQPKCPLANEWINKKCGVSIQRNIILYKKNEVQTHVYSMDEL